MTTETGFLSSALLALYYLTLAVLAFYGVHRLALAVVYLRTRRQGSPELPALEDWPPVTIQLPLYNEMYVARRLIQAVAGLDYPAGKLEIQVLDDSSDETVDIVAREVAVLRARGVEIHHLRRPDRRGFKAGALAHGLSVARGELIAVFDADFVPEPDFLRRTVPYLAVDPGLAMVQARWTHLNRSYSLLTRIQALFLDGHFVVEHTARHRGGCFFNFNGTAGVWRRRAIEEAGNWQHDTVTEDLDLSYRAQLAGWRFLYLPDVTVPAELPVDVHGFKSQQRRWAKGSIQTGRKLLGRLLRAKLPLRVRAEALVHLTNNASYLLMVAVSVLVFPAMMIRRGSPLTALLLIDLPLFLAATASVLFFYGVSQQAQKRTGELRFLPAVMGLGIGLALSNSQAVLAGLLRSGGVFERTPKYAVVNRTESWAGKRYRSPIGLTTWLEGLFALYFLACSVYALSVGMLASLPFLYLFLQGYTYVFLLSVAPLWQRQRPGSAAPVSTDIGFG